MSAQLNPVLSSYPIAEISADFDDFATQYAVLPATFAHTLDHTWAQLTAAAHAHGWHTAADLLRNHPQLLREIAGVKNLTGRHPREVRDRIHRLRNVLLMVLLGAAHIARIDTADIPEQVTTLTRRTQETKRPLCDDEIALLRTRAVTIISTCPRSARAGHVYVLCDAGQEIREATHVTTDDLDDPDIPAFVRAPGRRGLAPRKLPLEKFHTIALRIGLATLGATHAGSTIAYDARTREPGSDQAMMSAYGVVERHLGAVGLRHPDVSPSSIRAWRLNHIYRTHGLEVAVDHSGLGADQAMKIIRLQAPTAAAGGHNAEVIDRF